MFRFSCRSAFLAALALMQATVSADITRNGVVSWDRVAGTATYNALTSDKLVVVVSGEHNFANNYTGNCTGVTYNGQPMVKAVGQIPVNPGSGGHGQTHSSIWYLDNPGDYPGAGIIQPTCVGGSWVATAVGLFGTLPGVGATATAPKSATCNIATSSYSPMIIAAIGMGGQGNTASPLPGVTAVAPAGITTLGGLKIGSNYAGHAVGAATVALPSTQAFTFNTAKTDVVTIAAVFKAANPAVPAGPTPVVQDLIPGQSVELTWSNLLATTGQDVWVDVWLGDSPTTLQKVVTADPDGLNLTTTSFTAPAPGIYHGRIDSYLNGSPTGTPNAGPAFTFEVSSAGLRAETWTGLRGLATLLNLQQEGIAVRGPDSTARVTYPGIAEVPAGVGIRLRGQFTPATTGAHVFHIAGSENCTLWLSTGPSRFQKQRAAWSLDATAPEQWGKYPTQTSAPIQLEAGVAYYLEAQVINTAGLGHLAIGWTPPGATAPAPIPAERLTCLTVDPADENDNNLPDAWEESTGLDQSNLPGAASEYGDPDRDGISNLDEYRFNSNPLEAEELPGGLTRETWSTLGGHLVFNLVTNVRFHDLPNEIVHAPGIDQQSQLTNYGTRHRGFLVAPSTGIYRFWITGADEAELWLADATITPRGENQPRADRFGKRLIAHNAPTSPVKTWYWPAPYEFDILPSQRSAAIHLVQGQAYYIEALQKRFHGTTGHVSVAWQPPGQSRTLLPGGVLVADFPNDGDLDDDHLPDTWQTAKGLVGPTYTVVQRGQSGDPDADGLKNLIEYQHGTNPLAADTDGDGISDKTEIQYYHTDPLVPNTLAPATVASPVLQQYDTATTTGAWVHNADGSVSAADQRGAITYHFTLAQPGVHEVILQGAAIGAVRPVEELPIVMSLDASAPFASGLLVSNNGGQGTMRGVTPWLAAGPHTLTILHDNYRAARRLRIDSIQINRLGGQDLDEDGVPDWMEQNALAANALTRIPSESRTSPLSIEGITQDLATATLQRSAGVPPATGTPELIELTQSINNTFFADVPLSESGPVTLSGSFLSGLVTSSHSVTWIPTNLFGTYQQDTLHVRQGDALRLDAWSGASPDGQPFTVTLNGTLLAASPLPLGEGQGEGEPITVHTSGQPFVATFSTAGTFTLAASHGGQQATVSLVVHRADFGPAFSVSAYSPRAWTPPVLGADAVVEADDRVVLQQTSNSPRSFQAAVKDAGNRHVIARLPAGIDGAPSAILARGTVRGFYLAYIDQTSDARVVTRFADGTWLMSTTLIAVNLPPDILLKLTTLYQGALFPDGTRYLWLDSDDFDANGIATIYFEYAGDEPRMCNNLQAFLKP